MAVQFSKCSISCSLKNKMICKPKDNELMSTAYKNMDSDSYP